MHGDISGPVTDAQRDVLNALHDSYDMRAHTRGDSRQATKLTPEFIDRFAIVGNPARCRERLAALAQLGLDKFILSGLSGDGLALFEREVLPAVTAS